MDMSTSLGDITKAANLTAEDAETLTRLISLWTNKRARNLLRSDFYHMHVRPDNIGIAIKDDTELRAKLVTACGWARKAVDMPAERSVLDAFLLEGGVESQKLNQIVADNRLIQKYQMGVTSECIHSFVCWTLSRNKVGRSNVSIKLHSAETSAVEWDGENERVRDGMAIIATRPASVNGTKEIPCIVNLYTVENTVVLTLNPDNIHWTATYHKNKMGRPLIEAMAYKPTLKRPFGQSRISRSVMSIVINKIREDMRTELSAEFFTAPQKYLLGADDEAFDMDRYQAYIGNIFLASKDEDGDVPQFGQLPQGSMQPHVDYTRQLAASFACETGIPIHSLGIVQDNPSSAEALHAAERDLVQIAETINKHNAESLRNVMLMAQAIDKGIGVSMDELDDDEYSVIADFADPSMPDVVAQADAWQKLATAAPWIAETEEFLEGVGIPRAKRMRMLNQKRRIQGRSFMEQEDNGDDTNGFSETLPAGAGGGEATSSRVSVSGAVGGDAPQGNGGIIA
jgi:hypothetical protein